MGAKTICTDINFIVFQFLNLPTDVLSDCSINVQLRNALLKTNKASTMKSYANPVNLIMLPAVCKKVQLGKTSLYSKLNPKSKYHDPKFPNPIKISDSRIAWIEEEVDLWIEQKIDQRIINQRNN